MQGTLGRANCHEDPECAFPLSITSRKREANNQRTSGRPSTTDNNYSLPFSCSLPSRSFHLFAPNEARELVCKYFLSYLPDKDHSRSDPPLRQHVFQSSSFVSSFPNFVPVHYAVRRAASWLNSYNGSVPNPPIFNISLICVFLPGRTTRSTVTGAPPPEEDHQSLHVLDNSSVIISTLYSAQQSS